MEIALLTARTPDIHPQSRGATLPLGSVLAVRTREQTYMKWLEMLGRWASPRSQHIYAGHSLVQQLMPYYSEFASALYAQAISREVTAEVAWRSVVEGTPLATQRVYWPWSDADLKRSLVVSGDSTLDGLPMSGLAYCRPEPYKFWRRGFWRREWLPRGVAKQDSVELTAHELAALADPNVVVAPRLDITLGKSDFVLRK